MLKVTVTCPTLDESFDPKSQSQSCPQSPQPSHHTAAPCSCSTRLLTGRGSLLHRQAALPFNEVPNNNLLRNAARNEGMKG